MSGRRCRSVSRNTRKGRSERAPFPLFGARLGSGCRGCLSRRVEHSELAVPEGEDRTPSERKAKRKREPGRTGSRFSLGTGRATAFPSARGLRTLILRNAVPALGRPDRHLHAGAEAELLQKVLHVHLDRTLADAEMLGDFVV